MQRKQPSIAGATCPPCLMTIHQSARFREGVGPQWHLPLQATSHIKAAPFGALLLPDSARWARPARLRSRARGARFRAQFCASPFPIFSPLAWFGFLLLTAPIFGNIGILTLISMLRGRWDATVTQWFFELQQGAKFFWLSLQDNNSFTPRNPPKKVNIDPGPKKHIMIQKNQLNSSFCCMQWLPSRKLT